MSNASVTQQWEAILQEIKMDAVKGTREAMAEASKKGALLLRQTSPVAENSKRKGKYARGWTSSVEEYAGYSTEAYIYNKTDWQLTHLLEKGHTIKNRFGGPYGTYGGVEHILSAENEVFAFLIREIPVRISRGLK